MESVEIIKKAIYTAFLTFNSDPELTKLFRVLQNTHQNIILQEYQYFENEDDVITIRADGKYTEPITLIDYLRQEKTNAVKNQNFQYAANIRNVLKELDDRKLGLGGLLLEPESQNLYLKYRVQWDGASLKLYVQSNHRRFLAVLKDKLDLN